VVLYHQLASVVVVKRENKCVQKKREVLQRERIEEFHTEKKERII